MTMPCNCSKRKPKPLAPTSNTSTPSQTAPTQNQINAAKNAGG